MTPGFKIGSAALILATAAALCLSFVPSHVMVDDAYISFRYAENLAAGDGLVYNRGDRIEGYTNFLWVLALAAARGAGFDIPCASQVFGLLAGLGTLVVTFGLARSLLPGRHPLLHAAPPLLLALDRSFWFWAMSGMETCIFTLLVTLGVLLFLGGARRSDVLAATALFVAALTRPEGVLVFGLALTHRLLFPGGRPRRSVLLPVGIFAVLLAAYLLWKQWYFGELIPNTFFAKSVGETALIQRGALYVRNFVLDHALLAALFAAALFRPPDGLPRQRVLLLGGIVVVYVAYVAAVGGDIFYHDRFLMPVLPLLLCVAAASLGRAADALSSRGRLVQVAATAALALLSQGTAVYLEERRYSELVAADRELNEQRLMIAGFLKSHFPPSTTIATVAAGIIPYTTGFPTVDMLGLTNREIGRSDVGEASPALLAHQKSSASYVLGKRPEFIDFGVYNTYVPREVGSAGWPLDFATYAGPFYLSGLVYPARRDLVLSEEFHRNYTFMVYPIGDSSNFTTCRRLPVGAIPEARAIANLGWAQHTLGYTGEALATLERARALAPSDATVLDRLALVRQQTRPGSLGSGPFPE